MSILDTIGNTPLISINNLFPEIKCKLFAKCEFLNPFGSIKDRMVHFVIKKLERRKKT